MTERRQLPKYEGRLAPAPWSTINLTPEIRKQLKAGALRGCEGCLGRGYTGDLCSCNISMLPDCQVCAGTFVKPGTAQVCRCTNRPLTPGE